MSALMKIVGGVTAAATLGGGAYLANVWTEEEENTDDVSAVSVELPSVNVPKIVIPGVAKAEDPTVRVTTPDIRSVEVADALDAAAWGIDLPLALPAGVTMTRVEYGTVTGIAVTMPDGGRITVSNPTVAAIVAMVPSLGAAVTDNPDITVPELVKLLVNTPRVDARTVEAVSAAIPSVAKADERIPLIQAFVAECRKTFRDRRGVSYDESIRYDNNAIHKWLDLIKSQKTYELECVRMQKGLRMIAEIHHPIDATILDRNLEFYAFANYNAALITFGYDGENLSQLLDTASLIRSKGMAVWFAYAGPERLQHSVFRDPDRLAAELRTLAAACDGFLIGWRRTSLHLYEPDAGYLSHVLRAVRSGNPGIIILGEAYYGQTASSNEIQRNLQYNIPTNSSGVLIAGLGYHGVAVEPCMRQLLGKVAALDRVALILGDKPYYATARANDKTFAQNLAIKIALEKRWTSAGCVGTITLHGDGSDGIYSKKNTDNLAATEVTP